MEKEKHLSDLSKENFLLFLKEELPKKEQKALNAHYRKCRQCREFEASSPETAALIKEADEGWEQLLKEYPVVARYQKMLKKELEAASQRTWQKILKGIRG